MTQHLEEDELQGTTAFRTTSYASVLARREFGSLFAAHLLSLLGDRLATIAISVLVFDRSGSVLLTAAAYGTSLLPWLLGAPFLAALSDRWPRRRVLVTCDVARALLVTGLALPGVPLAVLLLMLTAVAWLGPPFEAARAATLPVVLPDEDDYVAGSALTMLSNQASQVLGLGGGGLLLAVVSTHQALALDAGSFVLSAALIVTGLAPRPAVLPGDTQRPRVWHYASEGARLTLREPVLRSVLLLAWLVAALTVLPEGLAVAAARDVGAPTPLAGLLMAAVPAGAGLGALLLSRRSPLARLHAMLPLAAVALVALVASASAGSWPTLLVAWLVVGLGSAVQLPANALFMRTVPDPLRARAFGVAQTGLMAGQGLSLLAGGALAQRVGIPATLAAYGAAGLVALALLIRRWPRELQPPYPAGWWRLSPVDAWIATVTVAATVAVLLQLAFERTRAAPFHLSPWILAIAFFATGSYVATVRIGRQAHVFQLDDIPRLIGLMFLSPAALIASRLVGSAVALTAVRGQRGRKLLFNLANFALEVTVALTTFQLLDPGYGVGPRVWPAALMATVIADLLSAWVVGVVIGLAERDLQLRRVLAPDRMALGTALGAAVVGMIAATTLWYSPASGVLILVLVALGMLGLRGFARLGAEGREQQRLQTVLAELANLEGTATSLAHVLETVRDLLAVEALECWLSADGSPLPLSGWFAVRAPDSPLVPDPDARGELAARVLDLSANVLGAAPVVADPPLRRPWDRHRPQGVHRLAVALSGDRTATPTVDVKVASPVVGALVASGPLGEGRTFARSDSELLGTVAGLLGQALLRVAQRHELLLSITHDRLTQLPTVVEFRRAIAPLVAGGAPLVVLMINLDRLRSVNDVFGRDTGDRVIAAAAQRTVELAPAGSIVARVSGHHFACAFPLPAGESIRPLARQLRNALELPFATEGVDADVGVHIGVSLAPEHGRDPDALLRRAEKAGDAAKQDPFGVAVFTDDHEQDVARPLQLVRDLRAALETPGELVMHYQPKLSLLTGDVIGSEALVRWTHPELGPVPPDEFIPLAERTGLITDITAFTLGQALRQSAHWQSLGLPPSVAVNLSARTLLDPDLVRQVYNSLDEYGVDPGRLTLEITETSVMAQPVRSVLVLDALAELGVQLSIDDFGTGYSNLTYLRQLPVQEVKLDRTFLSPLRGEAPLGQGGARAFEFLRHAVALVHSLGLYVVVEGVEDQASLDALRTLGADSVQGYFICRPLAAEGVTTWMEEHASTADALDPPLA